MTANGTARDTLVPPAPPDTWEYVLQVPHSPLGPSIARATVCTILDRHGLAELIETAELLTSELATNSFRYADGPASVRLSWRLGRLRVSVWDNSSALPSPAAPCDSGVQGRGLRLVDLCADAWNSYQLGANLSGVTGKVTWFELVPQGGGPPPVSLSRSSSRRLPFPGASH